MGAEGTIWCEREAKKSKNFCLISAEVMGFIRFNWAFVTLQGYICRYRQAHKSTLFGQANPVAFSPQTPELHQLYV
jgi:hypothetical protein